MKRRHFLNVSTGVIGLSLVGCGDDDGMTDAGPIGADGAAEDVVALRDASSDASATTDTGPAVEADSGPMDAGTDAAVAPMCVMVSFIMGEEHERGPHGEGLVFPAEDVIAGVPVQYDITGASGHPHTLDVTAEHFAALAAGEAVTIRSSFTPRSRRHAAVHELTCVDLRRSRS